ncbi:MAG: heparinase II/III family protein [Pelagimonas sp.]|jgi:uncharacterized heparinase superfamily protein|nr:heparinase II/III family protein [Pelagimonas sp.]
MSYGQKMKAANARFLNRVQARLSSRVPPAKGFVSQPEPRTIGYFARGRQMLAGNLMFAGHLVEARDKSLWDIDVPSDSFAEETHGFTWLDDLAAVGDIKTRKLAQAWLWEWIALYGSGKGSGWTPELTGRRVIRWVHHALFLLRGQSPEQSALFYKALAAQTRFLSKRGLSALPGLPRFEAMTGLLYAGLSIQGMERHIAPANKALSAECQRQIDHQGGIPTRNPEELLEVFTLLTWAQAALEEAGQGASSEHIKAIERIAPTLRALRHADGGLGRFHGGGRGLDGRLDMALAASGSKKRPGDGLAMGYARLSGGRTSVLIDASSPPKGLASGHAHASTLAFELTSGRRPLIVNCGAGEGFGEDWRRAGRATPSHSVLCLSGHSSAQLSPMRWVGMSECELLEQIPLDVPAQFDQHDGKSRFEGAHDGYVTSHGLTHARSLELSRDGRKLEGDDYLVTLDGPTRKRFDKLLDASGLQGVPFQIRFHLHPEADVALDMGGLAVSIALRSGEIWVFRFDGPVEMTLEPSVYLEKGRLQPRATQQIVLSGAAIQYSTRVRWSLAKAQDTATAVRDLAMDELDETV